jgi:hypothetical protein
MNNQNCEVRTSNIEYRITKSDSGSGVRLHDSAVRYSIFDIRFFSLFLIFNFSFLIFNCTGCSPAIGSYAASDRLERGLVVILDGAGGFTDTFNNIAKGLDDAGLNQAFEPFEWSTHDALQDQVDLQRNRLFASELTNLIVSYRQEYPGRPVHLVGLSAGTGLVIFSAEGLPPGIKVDGIFLLGSSLSSTYDLTPAMRHVRRAITNFSSPADVFVLGAGVAVTGTVDRSHSLPAGIAGFHLPKDASPATKQLYQAKLVEVPWNPSYVIYGDLGGHLGATSSAFTQHMIAPVIIADSGGKAAK